MSDLPLFKNLPPLKKVVSPKPAVAPKAVSPKSAVASPTKSPAKSPKKSPTKLAPLKKLPTLKKLPVSPKTAPPKTPEKLAPPKSAKLDPLPSKSSLPKLEDKKDKKDLREHLDTLFGKRNNITANPVEGVNYTQETLTYMTSKNRADQITNAIVSNVDGEFELWECCGGIGGNTMSFLDNKNITHVTVFEKEADRREMLRNNLKMYKLDEKATVKDEEFTGIDCSPKEKSKEQDKKQVLFFDPPWLSGIEGLTAKKEDYVLSGIKVGDKTLEEWALTCSCCDLVAYKVPPNYKLGNVPGFTKEEINFKNSTLVILKRIFSNKKEKEKEYLEWRNNLKKFLRYSILPKVVSSESALDKLVSDDAMKIWEVAFTNESFNPNVGENYEELELAGDVNLAAAYVKFMMASYPEITRSQLSEFRTKYLAKGFQSELSAKLGFGPHIRSRFATNTHILEDVLEAFFGALDLIGDQEFKFGAGAGLVYNMVVELYKDVPVDWEVTLGNPKTRVKEVYEGLGIINPKPPVKEKVPEIAEENENGTTTFSILIPDSGIELLKSMGVSVPSNILATSTENTKKIASQVAYKIAVRNLDQLGITDDFVADFKRSKDLNNQELVPYIDAIKPRLESEGYVRFYLTEHHVKAKPGMMQKTAKYIQLIGVDVNGRKDVLSMTANPVADVLEGKKHVLEKYAKYE